jgi:hypothetical protein
MLPDSAPTNSSFKILLLPDGSNFAAKLRFEGVGFRPKGDGAKRRIMLAPATYVAQNFTRDPCPICGEKFSRCGLPNHIRRHNRSIPQRSKRKSNEQRKSASWWDGWKEGYRLGLRDGTREITESKGRKHP